MEKKIKVTLYFPANEITKPVTYHLVKDYDLKVNILNADISLNKVGKLTMDIEGEEKT
jgi:ABC-type methionine transport system ATPase subunit